MSKTYKDIQDDIEVDYHAPNKRLRRQYRDAKRVAVDAHTAPDAVLNSANAYRSTTKAQAFRRG